MNKRVVYGINPVAEAFRSRGDSGAIVELLVSEKRGDRLVERIVGEARSRNIPVRKVTPADLTRICGRPAHQGVAAVLRGGFPYRSLDDLIDAWRRTGGAAFFLVLDCIQDPQNLGSLLRAAHCAGVNGVVVPKDRSCPVTSTVVKASAGATEHTPVARVTNLREALKRLKQEGVWIVGIEADSPKSIYEEDLAVDLALVIGSEDRGIRRLVRRECDLCVHIPMRGLVNSLNAAQAGAIALFEARRQKDCAGIRG